MKFEYGGKIFKMLGIICAMEKELKNLAEMIEGKQIEKIAGTSFISGKLKGKECVVAVCGIGKVAAAVCTQAMIQRFKPEAIINIGVAGSLSEEVGLASVVVAKDLVQYDMDTSLLGDKKGFISGIDRIEIETSKSLRTKLIEAIQEISGIKYHEGRILTGDSFIADAQKRQELVESFGGIACEMEGAAVAYTCYVNAVDFAVLRAISDNAGREAEMTYDEFLPKAVEQTHKIMLNLFDKI